MRRAQRLRLAGPIAALACTVGMAPTVTGCWATRNQVREIVASTNAAMVSPYLPRPNDRGPDGWQEAVSQIDRLIAANADQPVLVNQLQARAAMLLTVNRQDNLALARWEQVDGNRLNERDRAFYALRDPLVWWYVRAPAVAELSATERGRVDGAVAAIDRELGTLTVPEARLLLETIRAQMVLKQQNAINTMADPALPGRVAGTMASALERYVALFDDADQAWVQAAPDTMLPVADLELEALRHRVWLRDLVREFRRVARDKGLEPAWRPPWVGAIRFR